MPAAPLIENNQIEVTCTDNAPKAPEKSTLSTIP